MASIFKTSNLSVNGILYKDLEINEGEITFITGPSGVGKSTLLRLFNGTLSPDSGEVYYAGRNVAHLDTIALRREVSLISQEVYLFDGTIEENFYEFYEYRELPKPSTDTMKTFLALCCLDFPLSSSCSTLSGGEKQRVYLAIFLSFIPKALLFDEPTSALDNQNSNDIFKNVFGFCNANGITAIVVSHDTTLTRKFLGTEIELEKLTRKEVPVHV